MDKNRLFSVRQMLLDPGDMGDRFYRCLVEAKRFIVETSVEDILNFLFERQENRRLVMESVRDMLHVGFIIPYGELTTAFMSKASNEAGFRSDHSTFVSTVISRELRELTGRPQVPTTVFTAGLEQIHGRSGYFEAFIPAEEKKLVNSWIEEEVGTHVGLTLADSSMLPTVQDVFQEEGFQLPSFMHGEPIANFDVGFLAIYFEKHHGERKLKIEVLNPLEGAS